MSASLFDTTPDPIWGVDLSSHRFIDANPAALTFSGYSRDEFLAMTLADVHSPDAVKTVLTRCVPSTHPEFLASPYCAGLVPFHKKDGTSEALEVQCYVMRFGTETEYLYLQGKRVGLK